MFVNAGPAAIPDVHYPPADQDLQGGAFDGPIRRLHLNESFLPPSPKVVEAIQKACSTVNRYPDPKARGITKVLAERLSFPVGQIVVTNGSDQGISIIGELFLGEGRSVVLPEPSFPSYLRAAETAGAETLLIPLREDGANSVEAMIDAVTDSTTAVFVSSPNNPTGAILQEPEVRLLAERLPDSVLLVLDDAYCEFAKHSGGPDNLEILRKHRRGPWIVLRTLSKAYGIAGMRVGYVLCSSQALAESFRKVTPIFPVGLLSQVAAEAALSDQPYSDWLVQETVKHREALADSLRSLGLHVLPTEANFVAFRVDRLATTVIAALAKKGILIGACRSSLEVWDNYLRASVGSPEDTRAFLEALKQELNL
ncbi:histidinol-phosphate aminotransferase [Klebsormidium nitens]|uniref:histidinol-phosphate transaminase n=1 Tax=Klebsormidium nitens TaxID=105231 RepID=A0A1Y1IQJ8_KLENI|nr:histidinol-phosphate aminotransferase [Klebsormidium nitens]|eukprot:GAQ91026.1 histidinol-phosphate aminotransferase [Klebsormidium nitens]